MKPSRFTVICLSFLACPIAICWLVIAVVVSPVNGEFWVGPSAHVLDKSGETLAPSIANFDTARSISEIRYVLFVLTSGDHSSPNIVFRPSSSSTCGTVSHRWSTIILKFPKQAPATSNISALKIIALDVFDDPAIAETGPVDVLPWNAGFLTEVLSSHHYKQSTEALACQTLEWRHSKTIIRQGMLNGT